MIFDRASLRSIKNGLIACAIFATIIAIVRPLRKLVWERFLILLPHLRVPVELPLWLIYLLGSFLLYLVVRYGFWVKFRKSRELVILEATWGSAEHSKDATKYIKHYVIKNGLRLLVSNIIAGGTDPDPGVLKVLTVKYTLDGNEYVKKCQEGNTIKIP